MASEKLIVKNFGPIREAEIDLRKVTVFIGEQASGKSVLAKLIATFREKLFFPEEVIFETLKEFNIHQYFNKKTVIYFYNSTFEIKYEKSKLSKKISEKAIFDNINNFSITLSGKSNKEVQNETEMKQKTGIYIPAERMLISIISESLFGFITSDISLPKFLSNFGNEFEKARRAVKAFYSETFDIKYAFENNRDTITYNKVKTTLVDSSSGLQSILPLLLVLEKYSAKKENEHFLFITEEPESNLYPTTQKKLVEYLIEKCTKGDNRLIITTHSPYILTALDNLIVADTIKKERPEVTYEVDKLVPPQYNISYDDVRAYYVANGTVKSIMNEEYSMIDANALDEISNEIGHTFDQLLNLRFPD